MKTITLLKGIYCSPSCDGRVEGEIRGKSIFVVMNNITYRLNLKKIMDGETEIRKGWVFERADKYSEEELNSKEQQARDWLD